MKDLYLIGNLPWWVIALGAVAVSALLVLQYVQLRQRLSPAQTLFLVGLRACVYGVLLFFLFGPAFIETRQTKLRRPMTVLVDSSQSMNFPNGAQPESGEKPAQSRLDLIKAKLAAG